MNTAPRIAVVDDELIVAKDLESTLRSFGYEVPGTAPTGQEAITLAATHKPDLMLMDIRLRGELDGIEAARHIQQQLDVPIVYVTAYADEATLARARETYPYGYLVKPVQDHALRSTVTTALHRHRAERQTRLSVKRQRALLDSLDHLLWTAREDGRAEYFNQRWFDLTGLTHTASRGFGWVTALHPADMHECLTRWTAAVTKAEGFEFLCSVMVAASKSYRRHLLRVVPLPDAPGGARWLATLTDIHDYELRAEVSHFAEEGVLTTPTTSAKAAAPKADALSAPATSEDRSVPATTAATAHEPNPRPEDEPGRLQLPETFRDRFCVAGRCPPGAFTDQIFLRTLYLHALPVALLLWPWRRQVFALDFKLLDHAAGTEWCGSARNQLDRLRTPEWVGGLGRRLLRLRISTRRLEMLMRKTMRHPLET